MPLSAPSDITQLLRQWSDGDQPFPGFIYFR